MSKIHRPPRGLQHLLGSQSFGQNPSQLRQDVQPTVDLTSYYGAELLKTASVIGARTNEGEIGRITFSAPVALIAAGYESGTALAANDSVMGDIRLDGLGGTGESVVIASSPQVTYIAGGYPTFGMMFPKPLVVPGGAQVSANLTNYGGNLLTITVRVLYVDLNPIDDA